MKIVTYNVNGLRQRISQFGSLNKLLESFDADIICFQTHGKQETKVRRQELSADLVIADGYESFFSCTRTLEKGRMSYSGVATFCRVKSAFSTREVALPIAAAEGFTGLLSNNGKDESCAVAVSGLDQFEKEELQKIDSEGRCIITDHGQFILFNLYGPRAQANDTERIQFKYNFFKILQRRWEHLLKQGRGILVVGDLNIAPTAIDRCDAGPDFEKNEFRTWLRSMIVNSGGPFSDVFRAIHPDRIDAYTCWSSSTGAEQFNFGSRIDHILSAGPCIHQENYSKEHNFMACHIKDCDILTEYKRWKPGNTPRIRWKGEWNTKLKGSDHAPVYAILIDIPDVAEHNTPPLSSRYLPMIRGFQQTLASVIMKRNMAKQAEVSEVSTSFLDKNTTMKSCSTSMKRSSDSLNREPHNNSSINPEEDSAVCRSEATVSAAASGGNAKKAKKGQLSQLSLKSFFQMSSTSRLNPPPPPPVAAHLQKVVELDDNSCLKVSQGDDGISSKSEPDELIPGVSSSPEMVDVFEKEERNAAAVLEWRRIQQAMQNKIPLCKGHKEPCVSRVVKKAGPNFGRRFYTCARAEGPSSNPEANCGFFKWAGGGSKLKGK